MLPSKSDYIYVDTGDATINGSIYPLRTGDAKKQLRAEDFAFILEATQERRFWWDSGNVFTGTSKQSKTKPSRFSGSKITFYSGGLSVSGFNSRISALKGLVENGRDWYDGNFISEYPNRNAPTYYSYDPTSSLFEKLTPQTLACYGKEVTTDDPLEPSKLQSVFDTLKQMRVGIQYFQASVPRSEATDIKVQNTERYWQVSDGRSAEEIQTGLGYWYEATASTSGSYQSHAFWNCIPNGDSRNVFATIYAPRLSWMTLFILFEVNYTKQNIGETYTSTDKWVLYPINGTNSGGTFTFRLPTGSSWLKTLVNGMGINLREPRIIPASEVEGAGRRNTEQDKVYFGGGKVWFVGGLGEHTNWS